jgi:hypothetical protein
MEVYAGDYQASYPSSQARCRHGRPGCRSRKLLMKCAVHVVACYFTYSYVVPNALPAALPCPTA